MATPKVNRPRRSNAAPNKPVTDQANWRKKLKASRVKFDDNAKQRYLETLAETGRKQFSADAAGVSLVTVQGHVKIDPDFADAVDIALEQYRDLVAAEVFRRGVKGWEDPVYQKGERVMDPVLDAAGMPVLDEDGNPIMKPAITKRFSDSLLAMEIKRLDPSYRDKSQVDLTGGGGGVLVAPAGLSPEEFIAKAEKKNAEMDKKRKG